MSKTSRPHPYLLATRTANTESDSQAAADSNRNLSKLTVTSLSTLPTTSTNWFEGAEFSILDLAYGLRVTTRLHAWNTTIWNQTTRTPHILWTDVVVCLPGHTKRVHYIIVWHGHEYKLLKPNTLDKYIYIYSFDMIMNTSYFWHGHEYKLLKPSTLVQTHKRFKRTLIYYDADTQSANFRGNPLRQATKRHLNNS